MRTSMALFLTLISSISGTTAQQGLGVMFYWDNGENGFYYSMLGLYGYNGKENGNYYNGIIP